MSGKPVTVVGVDEAGYGPRLGPLVVGVSVFRVPPGETPLRDLLPVAATDGPVPVDDSKRIYRGAKGLAALERSVLAFRAGGGAPPFPDEPADRPAWGLPPRPPLPAVTTPEEVEEARAAVGDGLASAGVEVLAVRTRTVPAAAFNRETDRLRNKADLLFRTAMDLVAPWLDEGGPVRVRIDRHGGRRFYSELLAARFPERFHWVELETRTTSTYRFPRDAGEISISFGVKGDGRWFATALASMAAKYVRELWMRSFNAWFGAADPDLVPTAGYAEDAARWLADSADLRKRLGVPDEVLIRRR